MARDFLTGEELTSDDLSALLDRALELKAGRSSGEGAERLAGKSVALLFERPSTRTRVSFEVGVAELGGTPLILRGDELQLSRGESAGDTARVLSRYVHALVVRAGSHQVVEELARGAEVPVINGLTPDHHPCQALADLLTLRERFGDLDGLRIAYVGDGNNVARSLAVLGRAAGVEVRVASPDGYRIEPGVAALDTGDPREAAAGADAIYTDVWVSMGDEDEAQQRRADLAPFQVNAELLAEASERAIVLHCLPAHPGEEVTEEVLYGERSAVWDQAENRLHAQKALLELLVALAGRAVRPCGTDAGTSDFGQRVETSGPRRPASLMADAAALDARYLVPPGGDAECPHARRVDGNSRATSRGRASSTPTGSASGSRRVSIWRRGSARWWRPRRSVSRCGSTIQVSGSTGT